MGLRSVSLLTGLALALPWAPAQAAPPEGWHPNLEAGLEAAEKSGRPLLVITAWARQL